MKKTGTVEVKSILEKIVINKEYNSDNDETIPNCYFDNKMVYLKEQFNLVRNLPLNSKFTQKTSPKKQSPPKKPIEVADDIKVKNTVEVKQDENNQILDELEESKVIPTSVTSTSVNTEVNKDSKEDLKKESSEEPIDSEEEANNLIDQKEKV